VSPSSTRHEVTIEQGRGAVTARSKEPGNPGFFYVTSSPIPIDFKRDQVDQTLPNLGTLAIFSADAACASGRLSDQTVAVDGQELGYPFIPKLRITQGTHAVTLKCQDGTTQTLKAIVGPDTFTVRFTKPKDN